MLNNFTTPLDFTEMTFELRSRKEIKSTTQIGDYLQLITDSGEFYLKYNGVSDNEFRYSLFAEVGLADDFGENIYIESPEKVDYQLFSPFIANEAKQKYKKQAIIFFKGQIISEFYQRLNTHLPQNV